MVVSNTSVFSSINATITIIIALFFFLLSPYSYCLSHKPLHSMRGLLVEEKTRLGSTPPSCYNKCNQCHPCLAEQVPTIPSHHRFDPASRLMPMDYFETSPRGSGANNRYSNYKPLGWKCRCGDHFYNP